MKKLLITLRHPGPCQNIFSVLDDLVTSFEVSLVITDAAIVCADETGIEKENVTIYIPVLEDGKFFFSIGLAKKEFSPKMEFEENETEQYEILYRILYQLVEDINPDVVLRTTPVFLWGIDELMPTILKEQNKYQCLRCYQECYCAGNALTDNENKIAKVGCDSLAVVDTYAAQYSKINNTIVVGYLNTVFFVETDFAESRKRARQKMGLAKNDNVVLYIASCINDMDTEVYHFSNFLKSICRYSREVKIYIKFHPRHNLVSREVYQLAISNSGYKIGIIENMEYKELLSFSDCMISLGSSVNIDAVNYLSFSISKMEEIPFFVSVYPYGKDVARLMKKIYNTDFYPAYNKKGCHMIVDETGYEKVFEQVIKSQVCSKELLNKYVDNSKNGIAVVDRLKEYLDNKCAY